MKSGGHTCMRHKTRWRLRNLQVPYPLLLFLILHINTLFFTHRVNHINTFHFYCLNFTSSYHSVVGAFVIYAPCRLPSPLLHRCRCRRRHHHKPTTTTTNGYYQCQSVALPIPLLKSSLTNLTNDIRNFVKS